MSIPIDTGSNPSEGVSQKAEIREANNLKTNETPLGLPNEEAVKKELEGDRSKGKVDNVPKELEDAVKMRSTAVMKEAEPSLEHVIADTSKTVISILEDAAQEGDPASKLEALKEAIAAVEQITDPEAKMRALHNVKDVVGKINEPLAKVYLLLEITNVASLANDYDNKKIHIINFVNKTLGEVLDIVKETEDASEKASLALNIVYSETDVSTKLKAINNAIAKINEIKDPFLKVSLYLQNAYYESDPATKMKVLKKATEQVNEFNPNEKIEYLLQIAVVALLTNGSDNDEIIMDFVNKTRREAVGVVEKADDPFEKASLALQIAFSEADPVTKLNALNATREVVDRIHDPYLKASLSLQSAYYETNPATKMHILKTAKEQVNEFDPSGKLECLLQIAFLANDSDNKETKKLDFVKETLQDAIGEVNDKIQSSSQKEYWLSQIADIAANSHINIDDK